MHPAPYFRESNLVTLVNRVRTYPLGLVSVNGDAAPLAAHTPVLADLDDGRPRLRFHLSAQNPVVRRIEGGASVLVVFTGPDAYISPDWYGDIPNQVPTWNYLSVEAEGLAGPSDSATFLDDVSNWFETKLLPKPPWTRAKMTPGSFEAMLRGIRTFELLPSRFEGITKLNQNKVPAARAGVIAGLSAIPDGLAIAREMRRLDE